MKKLVYYIGVAAFALASLTSCTLDAESYVEKTPDNFPQGEDDLTQALAGVYNNLLVAGSNPQFTFFYLSQLASDDALGGGGPNDLLMQAEDLIMNNGSDATQQFWIDRYSGISRANGLIASIDNVDLGEEAKAQALGEAKFLRAFFYYELASMYGNVPLTLTTEEAKPVQPTAAQLWGQILQDLYEAASAMPAKTRTDGRVDKYTAEAMLGRAWLFYTGMYCNGDDLAAMTSTNYNPLTSVALPNGETLTKEQVIALVDDCVANSGRELNVDFRNLWAYTNRYTIKDYPAMANATDKNGNALKWAEDDNAVNNEVLFAIKFNKLADWGNVAMTGYSNQWALHFGVRTAPLFPFGTGWGAGPVAPNLNEDWKAAEPGDLRRESTILDMTKMDGFTLGTEFCQETTLFGMKLSPIQAKEDGKTWCCFENLMYADGSWTSGSDNYQLNNIHDLVLIRFADVLLMQSELKGDVSGINKVRARAGLSPIAAYSLQALQNERRWELAMEGIRWNDIRRWHIAADALAKQQNVTVYYNGIEGLNKEHGGGYKARYNATAGFFKIPESQVALSEGGITQNPGWEGSDTQYSAW